MKKFWVSTLWTNEIWTYNWFAVRWLGTVKSCRFPFWWIYYYCHISKSTRKETSKMHLCAVYYSTFEQFWGATNRDMLLKETCSWLQLYGILKIVVCSKLISLYCRKQFLHAQTLNALYNLRSFKKHFLLDLKNGLTTYFDL